MSIEKTSFQIEIRFDEKTVSVAEMNALAEELVRRGHRVALRSEFVHGGLIQGLARQAEEFRGLASNLRGMAETGIQYLRDRLEVKSPQATEDKKESTATDGFDSIGPDAAAAARVSSQRAVLVTTPAFLDNADADAMRIGFLPKTALENTWQPSQLDAMVIPHRAFRPYLEYIHWESKRIFEGGYVALPADCPSINHDEALNRFKLSSDHGPILLVMTSGLDVADFQTMMIQISLIKAPMQVFFYHGGDAYKAEQLRILAQKYGVNARMFGRVESLPDYLVMADLAVVHAKDENLALIQNAGVPAIIVATDETPACVNFLAHEGAALMSSRLYQLSSALAQPILDENTRTSLAQKAREIAQFASISLCADAIEAALAAKAEIIPEGGRKLAVSDGFETIGSSSLPNDDTLKPQIAPTTLMPTTTNTTTATASVQPDPAPFLTPGIGARSKEELHREYARLLMIEKNIEKSLKTASDEVRKWELRLDLARQNQRDDLFSSAMIALQNAKTQEMSLFSQRDQISQQKAVLRQSARLMGGQSGVDANFANDQATHELFGNDPEKDELENEFRKMQNLDALNRLKSDMGRR